MTRYTITRCPGCGRMAGVNGSTCVRPTRPSADDLALLGKARRDAPLTPEASDALGPASPLAAPAAGNSPGRADPSPVRG